MRARAETLRQIMLNVSEIDAKENTRRRPVVIARAMVAYALLSEGMTTMQVGTLLGKDHSTIVHYFQLTVTFLSSPGYEAERELLNDFADAVRMADRAKESGQIQARSASK